MFYMYNQNNSGGDFITNDKVCHFVIVEAEYAENADIFAEDIGIYFDGCDDGRDCPCCGDRWSPAWESLDEPRIYSFNPEDYDVSNFDVSPGADPAAISNTEKQAKANSLVQLLQLFLCRF